MKQTVPLTSILTGNTRKRRHDEEVAYGGPSMFKGHVVAPPPQTEELRHEMAFFKGCIIANGRDSNDKNDNNGDSVIDDNVIDPALFVKSVGQTPLTPAKGTVELHSSRVNPVGSNVKVRSIKSILMQRKEPQDKIVIDLDDETGNIQSSNEVTLSQLKKCESSAPKLQAKTVAHPVNAKPTKLKDIFSNFPKPTTSDGASVPIAVSESPLTRYHRVSALSSLEVPLPRVQLTEPEHGVIEYSNIDLPLNRRSHPVQCYKNFDFSVDEYHVLNKCYKEDDSDSQYEEICYSIDTNSIKSPSLWPELLSPKKVSEVMLEKTLKNAVQKWILTALNKLRKPTTRNKLLKSYKQQFGEFDDFIVADSMMVDDNPGESGQPEEFVPLMILYGEGIGKDTLIATIVRNLNGQIYEINASQNRAKRDILDVLSEFCTSYYVKDKAVSGVVLISDADVIFREHDKFFWLSIEKLLLTSRKPIIITARDVNFIPTNLQEICKVEGSLFHAKKVISKTVVAFLRRYCERLGLKLEERALQLLAERNNNNIRKCLLNLQFWFSSGNRLKMHVNSLPGSSTYACKSISEAANLADLMSYSAILEKKTANKSSFKEPFDHTLKSSTILSKFNSPDADDRFKWANDYMLDYRMHLHDDINAPLSPCELNIAKDMQRSLILNYNPICTGAFNTPASKHQRIINTLERYLSTRVETQPFTYTSIAECYNASSALFRRGTRGSSGDILSLFKDINGCKKNDGGAIRHSLLEDITFDFACTGRQKVLTEIFPYLLEVAKNEEGAKAYNRKLFAEHSKDTPETRLNHVKILRELGEGGQLRSVWFRGSPEKLISCWKMTNATKLCTG